jgi:hypothetical protein
VVQVDFILCRIFAAPEPLQHARRYLIAAVAERVAGFKKVG